AYPLGPPAPFPIADLQAVVGARSVDVPGNAHQFMGIVPLQIGEQIQALHPGNRIPGYPLALIGPLFHLTYSSLACEGVSSWSISVSCTLSAWVFSFKAASKAMSRWDFSVSSASWGKGCSASASRVCCSCFKASILQSAALTDGASRSS